MAIHRDLADSELHEPKGVASALAGQVYVADGLGSGNWGSKSYGGIYGKDAAANLGGIGTTPIKVSAGFTANMPASGITPSFSSQNLTVATTGVYEISFQMSFSTLASGDAGLYQFRLRVNGAESTLGCWRHMSGTSDTGSCSFTGLVSLTAADVLTIYVESDDGGATDDIVIQDVQFWAEAL